MKNLLLILFSVLSFYGVALAQCPTPNVSVNQIGPAKFKITATNPPGATSPLTSPATHYKYKYLIDGVVAKDTTSALPTFKITLANTGTTHQVSIQKSCGPGGGTSLAIIRDLEIATVVDVSSFNDDPIGDYVWAIYEACTYTDQEMVLLSDFGVWVNRYCFCENYEALSLAENFESLDANYLYEACGIDADLWEISIDECKNIEVKGKSKSNSTKDFAVTIRFEGSTITLNNSDYTRLSFYSLSGQLVASEPLVNGKSILPQSIKQGVYIVSALNGTTGEIIQEKILVD